MLLSARVCVFNFVDLLLIKQGVLCVLCIHESGVGNVIIKFVDFVFRILDFSFKETFLVLVSLD